MVRIDEFLDSPSEPVQAWPTGLAPLDELTGGFHRGRLWVITGAPGSGKSLLMTQLVHTLAVRHGVATEYVCSRHDHPDLTRSRLLSLAVHRAPRLPDLVVPLDDLSELARTALDALRASTLDVDLGGGFTVPHWPDADVGRRCLAVDDPEFKRPPVLDRTGRDELRRCADAGAVVLVTVPRSLCLEAAPSGDRLREEWSSTADLVLEIVTSETGEGLLRVLQNRHGPTRDLPVTVLPHYAVIRSGCAV